MRNTQDAALIERLTPADAAVPQLGQAACDSPKCSGAFLDDQSGVLVGISRQNLADPEAVPVFFEEAGPRRQLFFSPHKTKVAVVTCGGVCPGINDVIRSIVMEAHHHYGVAAVLGIRYGLRGFIPACRHDVMELTPDAVAEIHEFGGTILGSSRGPQAVDEIVDAMERLGIGFCICIGGVGTLRAASAIQAEIAGRELAIGIVCIPKTVDNDIHFVSRTFGFFSAVEEAARVLDRAHTEARSTAGGIGLVKLMGRHAGFIAAGATVASQDVNFTLIPEIPLHLDGEQGFLAALKRRILQRAHALVVVAEGAGQDLLASTQGSDASGNAKLQDIGPFLRERIEQYFQAEQIPVTLRYFDPSYLIRSVPADAEDSILCDFFARNAVHAAMAGKTGLVIGLLHDSFIHVPIDLLVSQKKRLDLNGPGWRAVLAATGQHLD